MKQKIVENLEWLIFTAGLIIGYTIGLIERLIRKACG